MPVPSIGRLVHYVSYGTPGGEYTSQCRAAVITEAETASSTAFPGTVSLAVFNPTGMFFNQGVVQDEESHRGGTWHWPERT